MKKHGNLYHDIDEALEPFSFLMEALTDITKVDPNAQFWNQISVEKMTYDFPYEMDVHVDEDGGLTLGSAPPTQSIETSYMPTIHNMKITVVPLENLHGEEEQ